MKQMPVLIVKNAVDIPALLKSIYDEDEFTGDVTFCPFHAHHRSTPSFHVRQEGKKWHCYACFRGGDVIDFIQCAFFQRTGEPLHFKRAVQILGRMAGLPDFDSEDGLSMAAAVLRTTPIPSAPIQDFARTWAENLINPYLRKIRGLGRSKAPDVALCLADLLDSSTSKELRSLSSFQDQILGLRSLARFYLAGDEDDPFEALP